MQFEATRHQGRVHEQALPWPDTATRMQDYGHKFDSIFIFQSLKPEDEPTGSLLFDKVVSPLGAKQGIYTACHTVQSARELLDLLSEIATNPSGQVEYPKLHFEMHGTQDGVQFTDRSTLNWRSLCDALRPINARSRFNLAVTMAACKGEYLTAAMNPTRASPVCLLIGCSRDFWSNVARDGFQAYYRVLLDSLDGLEAWNALNDIGRSDGTLFGAWPAKFFFLEVYKSYVRAQFLPGALDRRVQELFATLASSGRVMIRDGPSERRRIAAKLGDHAAWLRQYRTRFFMLDEIPENAKRFEITDADLQEIIRAGALKP